MKLEEQDLKQLIRNLDRGLIDSFILNRKEVKTNEQFIKKLAELVTNTWNDADTQVQITTKISRMVVSPFQTGSLSGEEQNEANEYWEELDSFGGKDLDTEKDIWIPALDIKEVKVSLIK